MADEKGVDSKGGAYLAMESSWKMVLALLGGTPAMRQAGVTYLPQETAESGLAYSARVERSVLLNYFRKTLESLASKPFSRPGTVNAPGLTDDEMADVDLLGHDLPAFARPVFKDGLAKGLSHVLVEFPTVDPARVKTLADERAANVRPYLVHIPAERMLAMYSQVVGGHERLTHVRFYEEETRRDGYSEVTVRRVRVLEPGNFEVWESVDGKEFKQVEVGETGLDFIPVVTFYANRVGVGLAEPPLMDLAYKNVEHWQASSAQRNVLTVARFPILAASGLQDPDKLTIGPRKVLSTDDPAGKIYYVEHTGAAIGAGKADLDDLKDEMAMLGVQLLVRKTGTKTATESAIDTAQSHSELAAHAVAFAGCLVQALRYMLAWKSADRQEPDADGSVVVELHYDFGIEGSEAQGLEVLFKARTAGDISRKAWLSELKRRGILSPDFDEEADAAVLDEEGPTLAEQAAAAAAAKRPRPGEKAKPGEKVPPAER